MWLSYMVLLWSLVDFGIIQIKLKNKELKTYL